MSPISKHKQFHNSNSVCPHIQVMSCPETAYLSQIYSLVTFNLTPPMKPEGLRNVFDSRVKMKLVK